MTNYIICPKCGSTEKKRIIYGFPCDYIIKEMKDQCWVWGGFGIHENDPNFLCNKCNYKWILKDDINFSYDEINYIKLWKKDYVGEYNIIDLKNNEILHEYKSRNDYKTKTFKRNFNDDEKNFFLDKLKDVNILVWPEGTGDLSIYAGWWKLGFFSDEGVIKKESSYDYCNEWDSFSKAIHSITTKYFI